MNASAATFHLRDPHGDVVGMVTTTATNQGTSAYDPWGKVLGVSGTQSVLGYQSDITDAVTRQVDMGTRWYTPGQGRFSSRDSMFGELTSPMTLNQHVYAGLNPVTMWDPTGMRPSCAPGCAREEQDALTEAYSESASGGSFDPESHYVPPPPPPPPPIVYDPALLTEAALAGMGADFMGALTDSFTGEGDDDPGCGFAGWRCAADEIGSIPFRCVGRIQRWPSEPR